MPDVSPYEPTSTEIPPRLLGRRGETQQGKVFLSFNFLSDRRSDKKLSDKNEQPEELET